MSTKIILLVIVAIVALVLVVGGIAVAGTYNSLVQLDQTTQSAWADVESNYQRRLDLIPNVVETVKGAAKFEQDGATWEFDSWSDRGDQDHTITTPSANTTYMAVFRVSGGAVGTGSGLTGTYYPNLNFGGKPVVRVDETINFNWGTVKPHPSIANSTYSVRWTGRVQPQFSETYTFYTQTDDGVRLFVNGQPLINDWTDHLLKENSGTIALQAGQTYTITMEYYDNTGPAVAKLLWSSSSTPKSIVPRSQLYP